MALILHIDTATEIALVCLADKGVVTGSFMNSKQKEHASFVHPAVKNLFEFSDSQIDKIDAVSVTSGPGSYTGLRVGMAAAKGLSYALNKPLITINTLQLMAKAAIIHVNKNGLYCPMIDARRMEVFTAVYDQSLKEIISPCSMIIDEQSFKNISHPGGIYFSGSGTNKLSGNQTIIELDFEVMASAHATLAYQKFNNEQFADVAYSAPDYLKEFYTVPKK